MDKVEIGQEGIVVYFFRNVAQRRVPIFIFSWVAKSHTHAHT